MLPSESRAWMRGMGEAGGMRELTVEGRKTLEWTPGYGRRTEGTLLVRTRSSADAYCAVTSISTELFQVVGVCPRRGMYSSQLRTAGEKKKK